MKNKIIIKFSSAAGAKTTVTIGEGEASKLVGKSKQAYIVADRQFVSLYPSLFPAERVFLTDAGECAKSLEKLEMLLTWLSENRCTRENSIIAVGGGTVGDLAGFAAAVYMRGIRWSVIPTTLLSMADSCIGGKTAVNMGKIKNLAGAFHQPDIVAVDPSFLVTLPDGDYLSGMGEIIKTAVIADKSLFTLLYREHGTVTARDTALMKEVLTCCCRHKAEIVSSDPCESDKRMILNAGHTIAHAIESDSGYRIPHGQAVATGLYLETVIGEKLKYTEKKTAAKIADLLSRYDCPVSYCPSSFENFIKAITPDKKQRGESIYIPFIENIGKTAVRKLEPQLFYNELRMLYNSISKYK